MTTYTRVHNFTTKDSLPTGDSNKKILGKEVDDDFNAARTAINSKLDASIFPNVTGSVTGTQAELNVLDGALSTGLVANKAVIATATPSIEFGDRYLEGSNTSKLYPGLITGGNATGYWDTNGGWIFRDESANTIWSVDSSGNMSLDGNVTANNIYPLVGTTYSISADASLEITGLEANAIYEILLQQVLPDTDEANLYLTIANGTPLVYVADWYQWGTKLFGVETANPGAVDTNTFDNRDTQLDLTGSTGVEIVDSESLGNCIDGKITIHTGASTGYNFRCSWDLQFISRFGGTASVEFIRVSGEGSVRKDNVTDGFSTAMKFAMSSGKFIQW